MFCSRCGTWASDDATLCPLCGVALQDDGLRLQAAGAAAEAGAHATVTSIVSYGGFWRRLAAVIVDSIILWFPAATFRVMIGVDPFTSFDFGSTSAWTGTLAEYVIGWFYAALLIASPMRGTLGLQVMDLEVTDTHGRPVSFARATWRYWAQLLSLFTLGFGYLMQLATPRRQTLHDFLSGTVVVRPRHAHGPSLQPGSPPHARPHPPVLRPVP
jgi:uncharacterized RDD family membrane protein YckC